ncbi:lipase 2 [Phanerochaete sordida]|uniref:GPI inositol-deacylase n=1 Tax=Phanerochaete sordida TaxID=48140 RepID=A0A9P3LB26_9APHY|nr:lipase 2 [Phanerochaete sordida]
MTDGGGQAEGSGSRPSLSSRLNFLLANLPLQKPKSNTQFYSEPASSRHSVDVVRHESMRSARTRPPSPRAAHANVNRAAHNRSAMSLTLNVPSASTSQQKQKQEQKREDAQAAFPVLRWFSSNAKEPDVKHKRSQSSLDSRPRNPPMYSDSPVDSASSSTSHVLAIAEALDDDPRLVHARTPTVDLPSRPKAARLPPHIRPWRPPSHLSDLSRSALPTAGLSPESYYVRPPYTDPYEDPFAVPQEGHEPQMDIFFSPTPTPVAIPHSPAPAHLSRSPPAISPSSTRSSIDTLRSIQERGSRGLHTTPPSQKLSLPSFTNPFQWFAGDDDAQRKENMDPFLSEEDKSSNAQSQKENIQQRYASPKNPVVFCHGLLGFDTVTLGPSIAPLQVTHWRGIKDALEANGCEVLITRVPATSSPIDRAKVLEEKISSVYPGRSVHLIGHSMGGLDCRYLTTHLKKRKFKVLSITTISSPHRGSSFADHFLKTVGQERMPSVLSLLDLLPNGGGDGKAFEFLTVENMRKFNEDTPDVPGVKYYSWGAVYEPGLIDTWKWSHSVILEKEGPNDGLVSLNSARWGTYLGTLEGVNHLDLVGWVNTARYKWAEIMGREIKFKPATFYLGIADHLARVAEGQEHPHEQVSPGERYGKSPKERAEMERIRQEGERAEMADSLDKGRAGDDKKLSLESHRSQAGSGSGS